MCLSFWVFLVSVLLSQSRGDEVDMACAGVVMRMAWRVQARLNRKDTHSQVCGDGMACAGVKPQAKFDGLGRRTKEGRCAAQRAGPVLPLGDDYLQHKWAVFSVSR